MTKWLVGLSLAAALAVAGCGGGGGSPLSKQDFIKQADAICTATHTAENAVQLPNLNPATASKAELATFGAAVSKLSGIDHKEVKDLKKLKPPNDFKNTFASAMQELSDGLDHIDSAAKDAKNGDAAGVTKEFGQAQAQATSANAKAKAYGLKVCGSS